VAILHEMAEMLPSSSLVLLEGVGHNVHVESPHRFANCIKTFLSKE
jgi:pimeloyl-ACP methyl ester carboxylesterase